MNIMTILSLLVIACMLVQHITITKPSRIREDFYTAWKNYRRQILLCRCLSLGGLMLIIVIIVEAYYSFGTDVPCPTEPPYNTNRVTCATVALLKTKEYTTVIMLTFFLSILKLLLEDHVERRLLGATGGVRNVWLQDIWLVWFSASVVLSVVLTSFQILDMEFAPHTIHLWAAGMIAVVTFTYDFWIYNVLHRQLTDGDGFMASAVSQLYQSPPTDHAKIGSPWRGFVGFMFRSIQYQPPAQVMTIGPTGAGKTHWVMSHDNNYAEKVRQASADTAGLVTTHVVEVANKIQNVTLGAIPTGFSLQLLDFPGENIGDHCTVPFDLRCDVLILILPEAAFNTALDTKSETFDIETADDLNEYFNLDEKVNKTRDYIYALFFGLNVDSGDINVAGRQRFGVGSFVLFVNRWGTDVPELGTQFERHMNSLALQLAKKFGLADERRCFAYHGDISHNTNRILSDAIQRLHNPTVVNRVDTDLSHG